MRYTTFDGWWHQEIIHVGGQSTDRPEGHHYNGTHDTAFDLTVLKAEQAELESEMAVVSDLIQKCIYENAHTVLDQEEYQKRYDGLTARFDTAKSKYEALDETIRSKQSRRATIEDFLTTLAEANLVDTFDTALWCGLVDFVTVHSKDDVRFTFKNGQEIRA